MAKLNLRQAFILAIFAVIAAGNAFIIIHTSRQHADGNLLLPLDDVYIHFQYARQLANGEPYVYNPGSGATSGATSFLYPYLLAVGYVSGFHDLALGMWAIGIGAVCLFMSMLAVARLLESLGASSLIMVAGGAFYGLHGLIVWHYFSGMETGFVLTALLWTLVFYVRSALPPFVFVASILALSRPEAGLLAAIAAGFLFVRLRHTESRIRLLALIIPIVLNTVQPLLNFWLTGSFSASGSQAKSILASVTVDRVTQLQQIFGQFVRIWQEWITGSGMQGEWYQLPLFGLVTAIILVWMLLKKELRATAVLILAWWLVLTASVATLDTAFWHFKRYQMPLFALAVPVVMWGLVLSGQRSKGKWTAQAVVVVLPVISALVTLPAYVNLYALNIGYVYAQPYQMASWLQDQTPADARIAVHDVGMMRYIGQRTTLDIVGLTTAGAAAYWRSGPGSVAEYLLAQQPDYIASYGRGHGYGLGYLADTALYQTALASFQVPDWQRSSNVALAADTQAIYAPDWGQIGRRREQTLQAFADIFPQLARMRVVDQVNVAQIDSEISHDYQWEANVATAGFATVALDLPLAGCADCRLLEGVRQFHGSEIFTLRTSDSQQDYVLLSIVHAGSAGTLTMQVDGQVLATRVIAAIPGYWMMLATPIPSDLVLPEMRVSISARIENNQPYMPARHLLLLGTYPEEEKPDEIVASYEDGAFYLTNFQFQVDADLATVNLDWFTDGHANGDYRLFVHIYDDVTQPPVAQGGGYPGDGALPPGNWIAGIRRDTISIPISDLAGGQYRVAIGFYDPANVVNRLLPTASDLVVSDDGRLWIGEFRIDR